MTDATSILDTSRHVWDVWCSNHVPQAVTNGKEESTSRAHARRVLCQAPQHSTAKHVRKAAASESDAGRSAAVLLTFMWRHAWRQLEWRDAADVHGGAGMQCDACRRTTATWPLYVPR